MTTHIQLDVSDDIYDKVIFFLENLPKNKVKLNITPPHKKDQGQDIFSQTAGLLSAHKIDPVQWQNKIRSEWDER